MENIKRWLPDSDEIEALVIATISGLAVYFALTFLGDSHTIAVTSGSVAFLIYLTGNATVRGKLGSGDS